MDSITRRIGQAIYLFSLMIRRLLHTKILRNHTSTVLSILLFCMIVSHFSLFILGFSMLETVGYSLTLTFSLFLTLLYIGSLNEAKRLRQNELITCFQFRCYNLNGIALADIGFAEPDRDNLNLLLNNLPPKGKIDFRFVSDNRMAADYKKLIRILHLLITDGIRHFKKERKEYVPKVAKSHL